MLKQEAVSRAVEESETAMNNLNVGTHIFLTEMTPIAPMIEKLIESLHALGFISDETYKKISNIYSGKAFASAMVGADVSKSSCQKIIDDYESAQREIEKIHQKYGGQITADTKLSEEDKQTLKEQKAILVDNVTEAKQAYEELDQAIKAIEADPELATANDVDLEKLKTMRDVLFDILNYMNTGDTGKSKGDGVSEKTNKITHDLDKLHEVLDKIQSAYKTVTTAIEAYNNEGYLSVDTFQELMQLEPKYLGMLLDENGNLVSNTEALNNNTAAYIDNIAVQKALSLIDELSGISGKTAQLEYLTGVLKDNASVTWDDVYATLAQNAVVSDPEVMDALYTRIDAIRSWADAAKKGIGKSGLGGSTKDTNKKLEDTQRQIADLDKRANLDRIKHKFDVI